jgi:predicted aminopeptidase
MCFLRIFLLLAIGTLTAGCANLSYYGQAVGGQLDILARTRPISDLLDDTPAASTDISTVAPPVTPAVKARLTTVLQIRDFATNTLSLPDNGSYRVYVDLDRQLPARSTDAIPGIVDRAQVAWNVVATPEFSLTPKEWCFFIVGCVPYRGYFSRTSAETFAAMLKQERLDVRVAGVAAYSTLGWFRDPVFSTQLRRSDSDLAALLFHELAHQQLYVSGDAAFNESFATTVEIEGMRRWLAQGEHSADMDQYLLGKQRQAEFVEFLLTFRTQLAQLYASGLSEDQMRAAKTREFARLRTEYAQLRQQWGGYDGYDAWFAQGLNNAHLASIELYHQYVPAFQAMLASVHGDLPTFYQMARTISRLPTEERSARLAELSNTPTHPLPKDQR